MAIITRRAYLARPKRLVNKRTVLVLITTCTLTLMLLLNPPTISNATLLITKGSDLRLNWSNIPVQLSPIAKRLQNLQKNCSLPVKEYPWRESVVFGGGYGIGSDLHAWGNALWAGIHDGHRVSAPNPWIWSDCQHSLLSCYFPHVEPTECHDQVILGSSILAGPCGKSDEWNDNYTIPEFRAAATEFAFSSLSNHVVEEARKMRHEVFGDKPTPENLITVHVRWGDKVLEGQRKNNPIKRYIEAIEQMVQENSLNHVHILLCTEDPVALHAFQTAAMPKGWIVHVDPFYEKYLPFRKEREVKYNVPSHIAIETEGKAGFWALASLVVSMEANYYVLTTTSNWSRLMNELRKNMVDPSCGGCTKLIDIDPDEC